MGKPFLQIRMPSRTLLQASWYMTRWASTIPAKKEGAGWGCGVTALGQDRLLLALKEAPRESQVPHN